MEENLVLLEDNQESVSDKICIALNCSPEEFNEKYKALKKAEEEFEKLYQPFKLKLLEMYKDTEGMPKNITIGSAKITYVSPSVRHTIDSKKLKEEEPDLAKKYEKITNVSATVKLETI
jgi:hypothetical protein